jgi:osmoprotectant transport system substrate-binding protein
MNNTEGKPTIRSRDFSGLRYHHSHRNPLALDDPGHAPHGSVSRPSRRARPFTNLAFGSVGRVGLVGLAGLAGLGGLLGGCGSSDPTASNTDATVNVAESASGSGSGAAAKPSSAKPSLGTKLVIGSQAYYSNEIVAEIYSQALEAGGYKIDRQFQIGQREVYLPEITTGKIDVFPEYIGSLLQALDKNVATGNAEAVYSNLTKALPEGLRALTPSAASDQNSWTVTKAFADKYQLTTIESLKNVTEPITVGGNSELETRPYGPKALTEKYGIKMKGFKAVEDSGGPLTVKALTSGAIELANIYTADPNIANNDLVALSDPDGLFLPDNIAPIVSAKVNANAEEILNTLSAKLTQEDFVKLNAKSINEKKSARVIAAEWLLKVGV